MHVSAVCICMYASACMYLHVSASFCITAALHSYAPSLFNQCPNVGHLGCFWSFVIADSFVMVGLVSMSEHI